MEKEKMKKSTKLWIYFLVTMSIYCLMLSVTIPKLHSFSSGLQIFDMSPVFDREYAIALLQNLGEQGRLFYLTYQLPLDMLYAVLYGFCYSQILRHFLEKLGFRKAYFWAFLPIISGSFDFLENIVIGILLYSFPVVNDVLLSILPLLTLGKMIFGIPSLLLFMTLGIWLFFKTIKNSK